MIKKREKEKHEENESNTISKRKRKERMKIFKTDKRKIKWSEAENCNVKKYFNFFLNEKFKQGKK